MLSEKKKMISGQPYKANDTELIQERLTIREILYDFNHTRPAESNKAQILIRKIFGQVGKNCFVEPDFKCDYGYNITVGDNFYANFNCIILDCAKVTIGNNVFFAPNVNIYTAGHPIHQDLRLQEIEYAFPVTIGNNVWIGGNVVINPNITIGDNVVIGSGSVVTKDIPKNVIAAGNPCKVVREITDEDKKYYFKKLKFV